MRNHFEYDGERAGFLYRKGVVEQGVTRFARPCTLYPPIVLTDWGVRPMWAMTGMPASTRVRICGPGAPPSSFTACAPASFMKRVADARAWAGPS